MSKKKEKETDKGKLSKEELKSKVNELNSELNSKSNDIKEKVLVRVQEDKDKIKDRMGEDKFYYYKQLFKKLVILFWVFIIGSVVGFLLEMAYASLLSGTLVIRKGLIYGPFVQVYGMGAVAYYLLVSKVKNSWQAFIGGMFMGGIMEYVCSFFQEICFGCISWDYSQKFMNFNGRTSILYCAYWGIIGIVFLKFIYPRLKKMEYLIYKTSVKIITVILVLFMAYDISISCMAVGRQMERHMGMEPGNKVERYLDEHYPDELVDKVYNNKKEI